MQESLEISTQNYPCVRANPKSRSKV